MIKSSYLFNSRKEKMKIYFLNKQQIIKEKLVDKNGELINLKNKFYNFHLKNIVN